MFALPAAGPVFKPDVPPMPTTDDLAGLHNSFAEREPEMGTQIFDGMNAVIPPEKCEVQTLGSHGVPQAFGRQFG